MVHLADPTHVTFIAHPRFATYLPLETAVFEVEPAAAPGAALAAAAQEPAVANTVSTRHPHLEPDASRVGGDQG